MKQIKYPKATTRSIGVIVAVLTIVSGVTFAALQSQLGVVRGNVIQTAIASLQVSADGTNYSSTIDGYSFGGLVPGGSPAPSSGYPIYVKNVGTSALAIKLGVKGPIANPDNVDLTKVHIILDSVSGGAGQNFLLQDLITANATGGLPINFAGRVIPTTTSGFLVKVSLEADAVNGPGASLSNIDFNFGASAVN